MVLTKTNVLFNLAINSVMIALIVSIKTPLVWQQWVLVVWYLYDALLTVLATGQKSLEYTAKDAGFSFMANLIEGVLVATI